MRSSSVHLVLGALLACAAGACSTDVGDQVCTEESIERDRDDECPYGPPGGPSVQIAGDEFCTDPPQLDDPPADCDTKHTFTSVFDIFVNEDLDSGGGKCTSSICHGVQNVGDTPTFLPAMLATNKAQTHTNLQAWGLATYGRPYIRDSSLGPEVPGKSAEAWILCNMTSLRGKIMPSNAGFKKAESLQVVRDWVNCGMRAPVEGEAGGAGVGGAGGIGGAGGLGGGEP